MKQKRRERKKKDQNNVGIIALTVIVIFLIIVVYTIQMMNASNNTVTPTYTYNILDIRLVGTDGRIYTLGNFTGKVTLVEFMATWCPHCQRMVPVLKELYAKFNGSVNFVLVGPDPADNLQTLTNYKIENNITFPILWDRNGVLASKINLRGYPTFLLLGKNGETLWRAEGEQDINTLTNVLTKYAQTN